MKKKILVLGSSGMLGWMVFDYIFKNPKLEVTGTERKLLKDDKGKKKFDAEDFLENPSKYKYIKDFDYIISCIGIIKPYCKDNDPIGVQKAIKVNTLFPHVLANYLKKNKVRIIQIATDCVYSGEKGGYLESDPHDALDVYGKSKSLGEVFIGNFLNIRCSIIGPEKKNHLSLLDWFLYQPDGSVLKGFTHHKWNGVTTLQFAKLCELIIEKDKFIELLKASHIHHFVPNNSVNKNQLLKIFSKVYEKDFKIEAVSNIGPKVDRSLSTRLNLLSSLFKNSDIESALIELKQWQKRK